MDFQTNYMRQYLFDVHNKIARAAEVLGWAEGEPTFIPEELVPKFRAGSEGEAAYYRFIKRVQSVGPRALRTKRSGAIGAINWGGESGSLDAKLESLDLSNLAQQSLKMLFCTGSSAAWAYKSKASNKETMQHLGGFTLPLYHEGEEGGEIIGIYQCIKGSTTELRYTIRIYDFEDKTIKEWRNRVTPTEMFAAPQDTLENQPMPHIVTADVSQDGWPISELATALPILKEEVSNQLSIMRNNEAHIHPILALMGKFSEVTKLGPNTILKSHEPNSKAERIEGADFTQLFKQHDRTLERVRQDLAMPAGFNGSDIPSGEALTQANTAYLSSIIEYSERVSKLLTMVVEDYAGLVSAKPAPVTVTINREAVREIISKQARDDYGAGIISLRAATVSVAAYYPDWTSDQVEEFLAIEEAKPPEDPAAFADDNDEG